MGGIHRKLPSPTKPSLQKHLLVLLSQAALRPHEDESHLSLHWPEIQVRGPGQGLAAEHVSGTQEPPGKGLPNVPLLQAQVGPSAAMMHWALRPQIIPSHMEVHLPVSGFSLYPTLHLHQAAWSSGIQTASWPQGMVEQGLIQLPAEQASWPGQSSSLAHSTAEGVPTQPAR